MTIKKRKLSSTLFFKLPHEIITNLIASLRIDDLISLGITSKDHYEFLKPYIYNCISLSWSDLLKLEENGLDVDNIKGFVECLKIKEYDITKEWNYNYVVLSETFQNLKSLKMNISNGSNFLKYLKSDGLILDELELKSMNSESNLFNIDHLQKFTVKKLKLDGFLIDFDEEDTMIERLDIINCSWNYPFTLDQFSSITELSLCYTDSSFIISERFKTLLVQGDFKKLESLTIQNHNKALKLHITDKGLVSIIKRLPTLHKIQLKGYINTSQVRKHHHVKISCPGDHI